MTKKNWLTFYLGLIISLLIVSPAHATDSKKSVVKIFTTSNSIDYKQPWQAQGIQELTGSGFVIEENLIMTNAHVVDDSTFIQVRKESEPKKYVAKLEKIGHDCDLAILSVNDEEFFKDMTPVKFGALPKIQDRVEAHGYPVGGDKLSVTEGVVSRIEIRQYAHSYINLLAVQIDAAINPGNSGGPVFHKDQVIGVAFQGMFYGQSIGYIIPRPIIDHFLNDIKDGVYDGFPQVGMEIQNTENPLVRDLYKISNYTGGIIVREVYPFSSSEGNLLAGDVILEIDNISIGVNGTYEFRDNDRLFLSHLITQKQHGEKMNFKIVREGELKELRIVLDKYTTLVSPPRHFKRPGFHIFGGYVFTILSRDLLNTWGRGWGDWRTSSPIDFNYYVQGQGRFNPERKKELVVLLKVLPDEYNIGFTNIDNEIITTVNGQPFDSFEEFVGLLNNNQEKYIRLKTGNRHEIIIDTTGITERTADIIKRNHIPQTSSEDVLEWL